MTVAELRELLAEHPDDMVVKVRDSDDRLYDVCSVDLVTMRSMALWDRVRHEKNAVGERVVVID